MTSTPTSGTLKVRDTDIYDLYPYLRNPQGKRHTDTYDLYPYLRNPQGKTHRHI